jgi:hypothetical protein
VQFVSYRKSYVILRGHRSNIIVLNVHAAREERSVDVKDNIYEKLRRPFDQFSRYNTKIFNDDGASVVNSATSRSLVVKTPCPLVATIINTPEILRRERRTTRQIMF